MKEYLIHHSLTKIILAALGAAVTLLAPAPALANNSWVRGGNWADNGDNFQDGVIYPAGITSSTTTTQAAAMADTIASYDKGVGINFVRIGINPATVSGNWSVVKAYVNELIADGMDVDLACWDGSDKDGIINNFSAWQSMWQTVDGVYSGNSHVFYEAFNEPHGYTAANLLNNVYAPFLSFISKSDDHLILDGTGYADDVTAVGADSRFNGCQLGLHIYPTWGQYTTEAGWKTALATHVGSYASRTIVTEMGAPSLSGLDYDVSSGNVDVCFIRGICQECRTLLVGLVYWPAHRANDGFVLFNTPGGGVTNPSLLNQLQYGWNFFTTAAVWGVCDFNVIGKTDYSLYRPSNDGWYVYPSVNPVQYGASTDIAVPADYNGTGQAQRAVWRPSTGDWYVYPSLNPAHWGASGDIPVPADYVGTGQAQLAVWRPSNGTWYINGGSTVQWGTNGDIPVPGYYNGDGRVDYAVYRPSNNKWYIYGQAAVQFGTAGDIPVPGDYTGSGKTQIAMFRPSNATWYIYGVGSTQVGQNGDVPVPGDYTGSGITQMATWRPSNDNWYVNGVSQLSWGTTGDVPLPLPYAIRHYCLGYTN
ncbi:cellulase family glycosylhydrolase [Pedosphaera parvula]|uniref:Glycoside hydrolase family 5 n=1 Tax=Pedosphaera parvula (strain Ellin514) TaxID=320771 RepID=B9XC47_PEDPL|nr:cellulase family glycosylhydrolase [Pedosphaera parvula]EEF62515.1 glycoside hydrolase family 5 [Pedosphaera parvula Ellin514]